MRILFKFPTLRLTEDQAKKLISVDAGDGQLEVPGHFIFDNKAMGKINACNSKINDFCCDWDILVLMSDDMKPQSDDYWFTIIQDMKTHYPDTDGVLWYNDGYDHLKIKQFGRNINTLAIMGRKYYQRFGYIYNPEYKSLFADDEFQQVAEMLGKQTYIDKCIIKHEHPFWTGEKEDELYKKNNAYYLEDKRTFERRKANNFYLESVKI